MVDKYALVRNSGEAFNGGGTAMTVGDCKLDCLDRGFKGEVSRGKKCKRDQAKIFESACKFTNSHSQIRVGTRPL